MTKKSKKKLNAYGQQYHQKKGFKQINQIFGVFSLLVCFLVGVGMEVVISG